MILTGPDRYKLVIGDKRPSVVRRDGTTHFVAPATLSGRAKLYAVSKRDKLLYVGVTNQAMYSRLRGGLTANGEHGYWGYSWQKQRQPLDLTVWCLDGADTTARNLETIEGEVVFRFRQESGQWPQYQTEIHFHPSTKRHRELARKIIDALKGG